MNRRYLIVLAILFAGCAAKKEHTTYWINNNTTDTVYIQASLIENSAIGPYKVNKDFVLSPGDSALFRDFKSNNITSPVYIFSDMYVEPSNLHLKNPKDSLNWDRTTDVNGKPKYSFNLVQEN